MRKARTPTATITAPPSTSHNLRITPSLPLRPLPLRPLLLLVLLLVSRSSGDEQVVVTPPAPQHEVPIVQEVFG
ncbi:MAG: hypothetical protein ACRDL8_21165, partial [Solirubrobacteraceae bacterium]